MHIFVQNINKSKKASPGAVFLILLALIFIVFGLVIPTIRGFSDRGEIEKRLLFTIELNSSEYITVRPTNITPTTDFTRLYISQDNQRIPLRGATKKLLLGEINEKTLSTIEPDQRLIVSSRASPVGYSFQTNMCSGYLENFQKFTPSFAKECPLLEIETDDLICRSYLEGLRRCQTETTKPVGVTQSCYSQTEKRNYNLCVLENGDSPDFYKPEVRIYLDSNLVFDNTVILLNSFGEIVGEVINQEL